jgi:hypothetical protein
MPHKNDKCQGYDGWKLLDLHQSSSIKKGVKGEIPKKNLQCKKVKQ